MNYRSYLEYLASPAWRARATHAKRRQDYQCFRCCRSGLPLEVHHFTYARLGDEWPEDLVALCESCHAAVHDLLPHLSREQQELPFTVAA